jgi:hypothetical protein
MVVIIDETRILEFHKKRPEARENDNTPCIDTLL